MQDKHENNTRRVSQTAVENKLPPLSPPSPRSIFLSVSPVCVLACVKICARWKGNNWFIRLIGNQPLSNLRNDNLIKTPVGIYSTYDPEMPINQAAFTISTCALHLIALLRCCVNRQRALCYFEIGRIDALDLLLPARYFFRAAIHFSSLESNRSKSRSDLLPFRRQLFAKTLFETNCISNVVERVENEKKGKQKKK